MRKEKIVILASLLLFMLSIPAISFAYNLMTADDLKIRLDTKEPTILLDIQKKNAYKEHHFYGSIRTFAYPAKTEKDLESAVQGVRMYKQTSNDLVIIGPRGGRPSKRTFDFLVTRGIPEEKIFILEGGIKNWPYRKMLLNIKGGCK